MADNNNNNGGAGAALWSRNETQPKDETIRRNVNEWCDCGACYTGRIRTGIDCA